MATLRSRTIRLAHEKPALRPYLLPLLREGMPRQASKKPLYGYTGPNDAYVVDDYPYGYLRTQIRYWLEKNPSKGFRFVSQTVDPKTGRWNKPKASTYARLGAAMYLDDRGHVTWYGVTEYTDAKDVGEFLTEFPGADKTFLKVWVPMKVKYYQKLLEVNSQGMSGWSINNVPQKVTGDDISRNQVSLEAWMDAQKKL